MSAKSIGHSNRILCVIWSGMNASLKCEYLAAVRAVGDLYFDVIFCTDAGERYGLAIKEMGYSTYSLGMRNKYGLVCGLVSAIKLCFLIKKRNPRVLYFQELVSPFLVAIPKIFNPKLRIIMHNHGEFVPFHGSLFHPLQAFFKRLVYYVVIRFFVDIVIANSMFTLRDMRSMHLPARKISFIYNGVNVDCIQRILCQKIEIAGRLRVELGLLPDQRIISIVARLVPLKRIDQLIKVFATLKQYNFILLIVGDGEMRGALEALVESLDLTDRVRFLGFRSDARELICISDLFVMSSKGESFGLAVLEAVLLKVPVFILKDGGAVLEFIREGINGIICADFSEMREKLERYFRGQLIISPNDRLFARLSKRFNLINFTRKLNRLFINQGDS